MKKPIPAAPGQPGTAAPPAVNTAERAELQRQGAKSAARGESSAANPLERAENAPPETGEAVATWEDRAKAWREGHDAQRGVEGTPPPGAGPAGGGGRS